MAKVSVIVPVYNVEEYLEECLNSIVNQTLNDIEIICVNDGSTDCSLEILNKYKQQDPRIVVVSQQNQGLSSARNTGVQSAAGEYLYFIDSDDYIESDALEYLYQEAKSNELDVLYFDGITFFDSDEIARRYEGKQDPCVRKNSYDSVYNGEELFLSMRKNGEYRPMAWMQIISREYYKKAKLSFYEGILHEDELFGIQCILQAERASHRQRSLYHYRRRTNAIMTGNNAVKKLYGKMTVCTEVILFMQQNRFKAETEESIVKWLEWLYRLIKKEYHALKPEEMMEFQNLTFDNRFMGELLLAAVRDNTVDNLQIKIKTLDEKVKEQECLAKQREKEISILNEKIKKLEAEKVKERKRACSYEKQLQDMQNSYSFRAGRCLTWLPRQIRDFIRKQVF